MFLLKDSLHESHDGGVLDKYTVASLPVVGRAFSDDIEGSYFEVVLIYKT